MIKRHRSVQAKLIYFSEIHSLIEDFAAAARIANEDCHKLTLIVEELFTNTIRHGHGGDSDSPVSVSLESHRGKLKVVYEDAAPEYDSLAAAMRTDVAPIVNNLKVGGLGVALTFAIAESAQYAYVEGRNRIVITLAGQTQS
jgi:serine/threonine-protein kinase RsbW